MRKEFNFLWRQNLKKNLHICSELDCETDLAERNLIDTDTEAKYSI